MLAAPGKPVLNNTLTSILFVLAGNKKYSFPAG